MAQTHNVHFSVITSERKGALSAFCPTNALQLCSALKALQTHIASLRSHSRQPEPACVKSQHKVTTKGLDIKRQVRRGEMKRSVKKNLESEWDTARGDGDIR